MPRKADAAEVVIAGGGFAALEAAVALRALADDRVRLTVVAPDRHFHYRPAATLEAFGDEPALTFDLGGLVASLRGRHERDRLVAVDPQAKQVSLHGGPARSYDALILALGAESSSGVPGALTFRDGRDVSKLRGVLDQARRARLSRLLFAVPSCHSWSLPAYELALLTATDFQAAGVPTAVSIVTPERAPLEVFGIQASREVGELLSDRGIRFFGGVTPRAFRPGVLELEFDAPIKADAVIAVPELRGRRIEGLPASWHGFIPTDQLGRVEGLTDVYAAGDATTFPIKQGALAAQQADRIAHTIAADVGAPVHEVHSKRVAVARLLGAERPLFLRTELDEFGQPVAESAERLEGEADLRTKVYARYLGPYLAELELRKAA